MRMMGRIGLGLMIFAVASWGGWTLWSVTRKWCPVNTPLSLVKGDRTETNEFETNVSAPYEIIVEANTTREVGLNALACSLGIGAVWPDRLCQVPPRLKLRWRLTSSGEVVASGLSDEVGGGGSTAETVMRTIGSFHGKRGHRYKLIVESLSDFESQTPANPRLTVNVGGTIYELCLVVDGLVRWGSGGLAVVGLTLLLSSIFLNRRSQATEAALVLKP